MKFYVDEQGRYLGGWDENPPEGAIEVESAPDDSRKTWNGEAWRTPAPSFQKALADLNSAYQSDLQKLNASYSMAVLVDGASEAAKIANIRAQYNARKDLHSANVAALKLEYGV